MSVIANYILSMKLFSGINFLLVTPKRQYLSQSDASRGVMSGCGVKRDDDGDE
jgi:hypothetical protein